MFSRNKRQQKTAPQKPPIKPMPKEPVLAASPLVAIDEPSLGSTKPVAAETASSGPAVPKPVAAEKPVQPAAPPKPMTARGQADSLLSNKMTVQGNMTTTGALSVNGHIIGDITADEFELGTEGIVEGTIHASRVSISGTVNGAIYANDVALTQSARVNGDIEHQALSIESGAELNGAVRRRDSVIADKAEDDAPAIELGNEALVDSDEDRAAEGAEQPDISEGKRSSEALRSESTLPSGEK